MGVGPRPSPPVRQVGGRGLTVTGEVVQAGPASPAQGQANLEHRQRGPVLPAPLSPPLLQDRSGPSEPEIIPTLSRSDPSRGRVGTISIGNRERGRFPAHFPPRTEGEASEQPGPVRRARGPCGLAGSRAIGSPAGFAHKELDGVRASPARTGSGAQRCSVGGRLVLPHTRPGSVRFCKRVWIPSPSREDLLAACVEFQV